MKTFIRLLCLLFLCIGCGKEDVEEPVVPDEPEEPELPYDYLEFGGYHVKDTAGFQKETIVFYNTNDTAWIFGIKDQKPWFGLFNSKTKEQTNEWSGTSSFPTSSRCMIQHNPFKISDGYVFLIEYPTGIYTTFLLRNNKAFCLEKYEVDWGNEQYFSVKELGDNVLIYHPYYNGYIYSKEGVQIINSVVISEQQINDCVFLSGFKQEKVWLGIYKNDVLVQEYTGDQVYDRNIKIDKGYGEYEDYYVNELPFGYLLETNWGYAFAPRLNYGVDGWMLDLFFCKNEIMKRISVESNFSLKNWYNNSILVYSYNPIVYDIYSSDGELLLKQEKDRYYYSDPFGTGTLYPISYASYIQASTWGWGNGNADIRIRRYNLESQADNPVWQQVIANISDKAKVSWILQDDKSEIWAYQLDILNYDGSKQQIKFTVDINTGEIKKQ